MEGLLSLARHYLHACEGQGEEGALLLPWSDPSLSLLPGLFAYTCP